MKKKTLEKTTNSMQNYRFNFRKVLILLIAVLGFGQYAMASSYYAKVTANLTPTGSGTVYVEGGEPGTTSVGVGSTGSESGNVFVDIKAKPYTGYEFYQWTFTYNTGTFSNASSDSTTVTVQASNNSGEGNAKEYTIQAEFKALPKFYFTATGKATPPAGGTVTASVTDNQKYGDHYNSTSASTPATFGVSSINRGYVWVGWNESDAGTTTTNQTMTYTVTNNTAGSEQNITKYAIFKQLDDPTAVSASDITIAIGETSTIVPMLTPTGCFSDLRFSSNATSVATVDAATGVVTGVSAGTATITITAKKIDPSQSVSTSITVTVKDKCATPTISFSNITADGATATLATTTTEATIYYTINGSDPTASSTAYTAPFAVEPGDEVRAIAIVTGTDAAYWLPSDILTRTYSSCKVATPSILVDGDGKISFTCPEEGTITYKYCISADGSCTPTTTWDGTPIAKNLANNEKIIKVIATNDDCLPSDPATKLYTASGTTTGGTVYLNDYEDHTWTYYAGVPTDVDGGNYNTNYAGKMYSPDPRNVKITYQANGGAVSIDEAETTFVYYKTIEKVGGTYKYQVISNPFSKRPVVNSKVQGFAGWEITGGSDYIKGKSANAVLGLDEEIEFENLPYPSVNCTSAEIELTATWTDATIVKNTTTGLSNTGTYETNIIVLTQNYTNNINPSYPCTIMMVEPDGSTDYRNSATFSGYITPVDLHTTGQTTKIEFAHWTPGNNGVNPQGRNFTIGRGMVMNGTARYLYGSNTTAAMNQVLIVESGTFSNYRGCTTKPSSHTKQIVVFGNDYDRAKNDNNKLNITGNIYGLTASQDMDFENISKELFHITTKSGKFYPNPTLNDAKYDNSFYLFDYSRGNNGTRTLVIEGGEFGHIAGGANAQGDNATVNLKIRMKGGKVNGVIFGGAAQYDISGSKQIVVTGGTVVGWIAGGSNGGASAGTSGQNGSISGKTYVYVGGNAIVGTSSSIKTNQSMGGYVFGAGCGKSATATTGMAMDGTNVVLADNANVKYGVYGGGAYGFSGDTDGSEIETSNIYVTGGTLEGTYDTEFDVPGGIYGGARQNRGGHANIYMTGGLIKGNSGSGLYGGSNVSGTMAGNVKMVVTGGQVGTSTNPANIHGGGYGANTTVSQDVVVTLGTRNTSTGETAGTAVVYGDVYGGSALGKVNGTTASDTYQTYVTLNAGTINGSLYGGALGNSSTAANVNGPVTVKVYGGSVKKTDENGANGSGAVYGANNINGAPQRSVTVDIYGTDPAPAAGGYALFSVYGGGNKAGYTYGNGYPTVTVHNCDNSIEYVYGGGNAAAVAATDVTIYGGNKIGNVFGGGNGQVQEANVTPGGTNVKIYGGTIGDVYGGSNTNGTIGGTISVNVNSQAESTSGTACPMAIDNVYGGGNKAASNAGTVTIGCTGPYVAASEGVTESGYIRNVYGGANQADITGNIGLNIKAGHIDNVFGGNNNSGSISGNITVTVKEDKTAYDCGEGNDMLIGNVYGGGNLAAYGSGSNYPVVKIEKGHLIGSVFGGGKGDATDANHATGAVTGNPQVTIGSTTSTDVVTIDGNVFGGGDAANVIGSPVVLVQNCNTKIGKTSTTDGVTTYTNGSVYGGGNAAHVTGSSNSTSVTINGGTINRVFGGGNGEVSAANVEGNANTTIHAGTIHQAFAGSNAAGTISGTAKITVDKTGSCDEKIDELYGGGNLAEGNAGTVTVACGAIVDDVYGGANNADIGTPENPKDIILNITGGQINRVFGGNNIGGTVYGKIVVNINIDEECGDEIGYVYGGGNQANYTAPTSTTFEGYPEYTGNYPEVNIIRGHILHDVYGGGLGDSSGTKGKVTGNPQVKIYSGTESDGSGGTTDKVKIDGNVFGGGNAGKVIGNTNVVVGVPEP